MFKSIKNVAIGAALLTAASSAFAGQVFTISTALNTDDSLSPTTFQANALSGNYIERVTFNTDGSFSASIFLPLDTATLDGVVVQAPQSGGLGLGGVGFPGYKIYSLIDFTGTLALNSAGNFVAAGFAGALSVVFDEVGDSLPAATSTLSGMDNPGLAAGTSPTLLAAGTGTGSDDIVLATANVAGGGAILGANSAGFDLSVDAFDLTTAGSQFFVAPNPFFLELLSTGDLGRSNATGTNTPVSVQFQEAAALAASGTQNSVFVSLTATATFIPEPSSIAFIGLGLLGAGFMSRRRKA